LDLLLVSIGVGKHQSNQDAEGGDDSEASSSSVVADKMICVQIGWGEIRLSCGNIQRSFVNRANALKTKTRMDSGTAKGQQHYG